MRADLLQPILLLRARLMVCIRVLFAGGEELITGRSGHLTPKKRIFINY